MLGSKLKDLLKDEDYKLLYVKFQALQTWQIVRIKVTMQSIVEESSTDISPTGSTREVVLNHVKALIKLTGYESPEDGVLIATIKNDNLTLKIVSSPTGIIDPQTEANTFIGSSEDYLVILDLNLLRIIYPYKHNLADESLAVFMPTNKRQQMSTDVVEKKEEAYMSLYRLTDLNEELNLTIDAIKEEAMDVSIITDLVSKQKSLTSEAMMAMKRF